MPHRHCSGPRMFSTNTAARAHLILLASWPSGYAPTKGSLVQSGSATPATDAPAVVSTTAPLTAGCVVTACSHKYPARWAGRVRHDRSNLDCRAARGAFDAVEQRAGTGLAADRR